MHQLNLNLEISETALLQLAEAGFDPIYGARPLKRAIQSQIENPLSKLLLEGKFLPKDTILVDTSKSGMVFSKK